MTTGPPTTGSDARPVVAALGRGLRWAAGSLWVRVAATVALLVLVASQIDWAELGKAVRDGLWWYFALAVALVAVALVLGGVRWHLLLRAAEVPTTPGRTCHAYAIGLFSNLFLPTSMGGDAARAWLVGRSGPTLVAAAVTVIVDRLSAIACLFVLAWGSVVVDPSAVPTELVVALAVTTAVGVILLALAIAAAGPGRGKLASVVPLRVRPLLVGALRAGRATLAPTVRTIWVFALGFMFQALMIFATWALARSIRMDLPISLVAVAVTLVLVVTLVPLSVAGFGLREGGYVVVLATAGFGATEATLLSVLCFVALALASAPGALALLWPMGAGRPGAAREGPTG